MYSAVVSYINALSRVTSVLIPKMCTNWHKRKYKRLMRYKRAHRYTTLLLFNSSGDFVQAQQPWALHQQAKFITDWDASQDENEAETDTQISRIVSSKKVR